MLVSDLLNQIKREGEYEASTDYDLMFVDIINEYYSEAVKRVNLREFLKIAQSLSLTAANQTTSLPSDWLRPSGNRIYFLSSGSTDRKLLSPVTLRTTKDFNGTPRYFSFGLNQFNIFPYQNVSTGDTVIMDYYSSVSVLTSASTMPANFVTLCKHGTLSRILNVKDSKRAQLHAGLFRDAMLSLTNNGASN